MALRRTDLVKGPITAEPVDEGRQRRVEIAGLGVKIS